MVLVPVPVPICGPNQVSVADRGPEAVHSGGAGLLVPGAQKRQQQEAQCPCKSCVCVKLNLFKA